MPLNSLRRNPSGQPLQKDLRYKPGMKQELTKNTLRKWLHVAFALLLAICFFLPWTCWKEIGVRGYYMANGKFFDISESQFGLGNPFPKLAFAFNIIWLIPVLALVTAILAIQNKKTSWLAFIAGALSLGLITIYFLFTRQDLAIEKNVLKVLSPGGWLAVISSLGLILTVLPDTQWYKKATWIIVGPLFAFLSHMIIEKKIMSETQQGTESVKADYTMNAEDLIHEFLANDSVANKKYREKILVVNGTAAQVQPLGDSTVNIKFTDTTGSYIIFSLEKDQYVKSREIKAGDEVGLKGSCSGSVYSEILSTTSISFKRGVLNK